MRVRISFIINNPLFYLILFYNVCSRNARVLFENVSDDKVDDSKGKGANDKANDSIDDGFFGFVDFAGVAGGSHIIDAANYDKDYGYDTEDTNDDI